MQKKKLVYGALKIKVKKKKQQNVPN